MADRSIEKIYEIVKPDNIMVISDHGFTDAATKFFYINQYLEDRGFLEMTKDVKGNFSIFLYKFGMQVVSRFGFMKKLLPKKAKSRMMYKSIKEKIDWERTKAYAK